VPHTAVIDPRFRSVVVATLLVGVTYGVLPRRLAAFAPAAFDRVPDRVAGHVSDRYRR